MLVKYEYASIQSTEGIVRSVELSKQEVLEAVVAAIQPVVKLDAARIGLVELKDDDGNFVGVRLAESPVDPAPASPATTSKKK